MICGNLLSSSSAYPWAIRSGQWAMSITTILRRQKPAQPLGHARKNGAAQHQQLALRMWSRTLSIAARSCDHGVEKFVHRSADSDDDHFLPGNRFHIGGGAQVTRREHARQQRRRALFKEGHFAVRHHANAVVARVHQRHAPAASASDSPSGKPTWPQPPTIATVRALEDGCIFGPYFSMQRAPISGTPSPAAGSRRATWAAIQRAIASTSRFARVVRHHHHRHRPRLAAMLALNERRDADATRAEGSGDLREHARLIGRRRSAGTTRRAGCSGGARVAAWTPPAHAK